MALNRHNIMRKPINFTCGHKRTVHLKAILVDIVPINIEVRQYHAPEWNYSLNPKIVKTHKYTPINDKKWLPQRKTETMRV